MKSTLLRQTASLLVAGALGLPLHCVAASQDANAQTARAAAPVELTGYWVSLVTEDWHYRMVTPPKGDYDGVPLNAEGKRVANLWDPKQAQSDECKPYGAPNLLKVPEHLHIYWQDDNTLRLDTDAGMQTRLLRFGASPPADAAPTLQGYSVASWQGLWRPVDRPEGGFSALLTQQAPVKEGYLHVVTTDMLPGYLRKNGVPFSAKANLDESFYRITGLQNDVYLIAQSVVVDPQYLLRPFVVSTEFGRLTDAKRWNPVQCGAPL